MKTLNEPKCISTVLDRASGVITITGRGLFGETELGMHFVELARMLREVRASGRTAKVLVDLRAALVQRIGAAEAIADHNHRTYGPQDRLAIVTTSALYAMQMKRSHSDARFGVFTTMGEAEEFLGA